MAQKTLTIDELRERMGNPSDRGFCSGYSFSTDWDDYHHNKDFDFILADTESIGGEFKLLNNKHDQNQKRLCKIIFNDFYLAIENLGILPENYKLLGVEEENGDRVYLQTPKTNRLSKGDERFFFGAPYDTTLGHFPQISYPLGKPEEDLRGVYLIGGKESSKPGFDARTDHIVSAYAQTIKNFRKEDRD